MSYFTLGENNNKEEIKQDMGNISNGDTPIKKKRVIDHRGELNPHFGHIQTPESRKKISEKQKARYDMINKLVRKGMQKPLTEERVQEIVDDSIRRFIKENCILINEIKDIDNNDKPININQ